MNPSNLTQGIVMAAMKNVIVQKVSNGHSPQIRQNGKLLVRMCRGESHFSQKWPLANVGESGESSQHGLTNVGESGESSQKCLASVGESGEYLPSLGP